MTCSFDEDSNRDYKKWGPYLRQCRKNANLTQKEVAACLSGYLNEEFTPQRYNKYEKKDVQPSIGILRALTYILKVSADTLLNYNPNYAVDSFVHQFLYKANIELNKTKGSSLYIVKCPDGTQAELTHAQLIACTFLSKRDADKKLKDVVDKIFKYTTRIALWENIENKHILNDEVPDIEINKPFFIRSSEFKVRLAAFREIRKLTQTALAKKLGLNLQAYNRYEKRDSQPNMHTLVKMAEQLQVSVNDLIGGYTPDSQEKALSYLKKINFDFDKENDYIILYNSHMNIYEDEQLFKEQKECFKLTKKALVYHLAKALLTVKTNLESQFDSIMSITFCHYFCRRIKTGILPNSIKLEKHDIELYLHQQDCLMNEDYRNMPLTVILGTVDDKDVELPVLPEYIIDNIPVRV